jgi:hypothetical protein
LPVGGADVSGVVMLIFVGSVMYGVKAAAAALVEPEPAAAEAVAPEELDELDELEEPDDPQAASASVSTSVPMIAATPRRRGRPPFRRSSLEWCVICLSFDA